MATRMFGGVIRARRQKRRVHNRQLFGAVGRWHYDCLFSVTPAARRYGNQRALRTCDPRRKRVVTEQVMSRATLLLRQWLIQYEYACYSRQVGKARNARCRRPCQRHASCPCYGSILSVIRALVATPARLSRHTRSVAFEPYTRVT